MNRGQTDQIESWLAGHVFDYGVAARPPLHRMLSNFLVVLPLLDLKQINTVLITVMSSVLQTKQN